MDRTPSPRARQARDEPLGALEKSFDSVMNRVSGWYKRRSTIWVVVFAILVAVGMNADSYAIGQRLWKDPAVRSAVVAQANKTRDDRDDLRPDDDRRQSTKGDPRRD